MDARDLRFMADCWDEKANQYDPESKEFADCIDAALKLRLKAIEMEDRNIRHD